MGNGQPGLCADRDKRIGTLEKFMFFVRGCFWVIGSLFAATASALGVLFSHNRP
jgi:hypothetical protein